MTKAVFNIFGDSHSQYFNLTPKVKFYDEMLEGIKNKDLNLIVSHGASIRGLNRKKSRLNIGEIINSKIKNADVNVFAFGQVDIELGYCYRKMFKGEKECLLSFAKSLVEEYIFYIKSLDINPNNCAFKGLNLSVLKYRPFAINYVSKIIMENADCNEVEGYIKDLDTVYDPYETRQEAIFIFNEELSRLCSSLGFSYFDINSSIRKFNSVDVKECFLPAKFDHHLCDSILVRKLYWHGLLRCLDSVNNLSHVSDNKVI